MVDCCYTLLVLTTNNHASTKENDTSKDSCSQDYSSKDDSSQNNSTSKDDNSSKDSCKEDDTSKDNSSSKASCKEDDTSKDNSSSKDDSSPLVGTKIPQTYTPVRGIFVWLR